MTRSRVRSTGRPDHTMHRYTGRLQYPSLDLTPNPRAHAVDTAQSVQRNKKRPDLVQSFSCISRSFGDRLTRIDQPDTVSHSSFLAMANLTTHASFLATYFSSPFTSLLGTHLVGSPEVYADLIGWKLNGLCWADESDAACFRAPERNKITPTGKAKCRFNAPAAPKSQFWQPNRGEIENRHFPLFA